MVIDKKLQLTSALLIPKIHYVKHDVFDAQAVRIRARLFLRKIPFVLYMRENTITRPFNHVL